MKKIGRMRFNDLPTQVEVAKSVQPKYYKEGVDKIPKKYLNYYYDFIDGILCEMQGNTPVVRNAEEVGKPRYIKIGGNKIHALGYSDSKLARSRVIKIKNTLKEYFNKNIQPIEIVNYPIHVEFKFYIQEENALDRDNLALFYEKIFLDCIQVKRINSERKVEINARGIIPNDDIKHINGGTTKVFFTTKTPYLIVNFYEYESPEEFKADRAGTKLVRNTIDSVNKLVELFADISLKKAFTKDKLYEEGTDEYSTEAMEYYKKEIDFYSEVLTNEFL